MSFCFAWEQGCRLEGIAAYLQAFFSVLAIVYASRAGTKSRRIEINDNNKLVRILINNIDQDLTLLIEATEQKRASGFNLNMERIKLNDDLLKSIRLELLDAGVVYEINSIRGALFHLHAIGPVEENDANFEAINRLCNDAKDFIDRCIIKINNCLIDKKIFDYF